MVDAYRYSSIKSVDTKVVSRLSYSLSTSCCYVATSFYYTDHFKLGGEAVSKRKPRSERHGWETSFKQALLLRAEGGIRPFFVGHCRGDIASGVRNVAITRRHHNHISLPLRLRLFPLTYRAWKLRGDLRSQGDNTSSPHATQITSLAFI